jgi:hypothetical protein
MSIARYATLEEAASALVIGQKALGQRMSHDSALMVLKHVFTGAENAGAPDPLEQVAWAVDLLNGLNPMELAASPRALTPMLGGGPLTGLEPMLGGDRAVR